MIKKTLAFAVTYGLIWVPLASSDPVPKPPVLCLQGSPCQQPAAPLPPAPSPPPATTTTPPAGSGAIKTQPGWYAAFNKQCFPQSGNYGCTAAEIVNTINTEICPNANLAGIKIWALPSFVLGDSPGSYTGINRGFPVIDAVLDALRACNKHLILRVNGTIFGDANPNDAHSYFPAFTFPSSFGAGGTATGGAYGISLATQYSPPGGMLANQWQSDWRDLAIAAATAYCKRYESDPAFYAFGMIYANLSLPMAANSYPVATFNTYYRDYLTALRAACPTTNVMALLDFASPHPAEGTRYLSSMQTSQLSMENSDTDPAASWGQEVYTGVAGSVDYRGVVRYMEEVETPEMCGYHGTATPAQLFDIMQNGNANNRPRWPSHIIITMASECPAGYNWDAWKSFIASKGGRVMNGRDSTLRTPAEVKTTWCEKGMSCQ